MKKYALFLFFFGFLLLQNGSGAEQLTWIHNFDQAKQAAKKTSKCIFVDVFADWCTWCKVLDQEVYPSPDFINFMKNYIPTKIDAEDKGDGERFAARFEVETLPTLIVTDSDGKLILRISGFRKTDQLIKEIDTVQRLRARETTNPNDASAIVELANEYVNQGMYDEAEIRIKKARSSKNSQAIEDALFLTAQMHVKRKSKKAEKYLKEFLQKYPDSPKATLAKELLAKPK
jgi:thioredoxin-related protein